MIDLAGRIANKPHLTTDAHKSYFSAVRKGFGPRVDHGMLIKEYKGHHYLRSDRIAVQGSPDLTKISTSLIERQNLTMRMNMRRFTRRTNGFSKKLANLRHAVALHFMHYNFVRVHTTLGTTPAIAAGLEDAAWSLSNIAQMAR